MLGQGPIGLGQTKMAQLAGPGEIIGIDVREEALEIDKKFGATTLINPKLEDPVEKVLALTSRKGADVAIECAGSPHTVAIQLQLVRKEGKLVNVGLQSGMGSHEVATILMKTLTLFGVGGNGDKGQYETALELTRKVKRAG